MKIDFSWLRLWAVIVKEFIQIKRDRATLAMMMGIPLMQLILFGYAINSNPRNLPTALVAGDNSVYTRTFLQAMQNTKYFKFVKDIKSEAEAEHLLATSKVLFVVTIPPNFTRKLLKGERPQVLIDADATDPVSVTAAIGAINQLGPTVLNQDLTGPLSTLKGKNGPVDIIVHRRYNPLAITQYNIVPALLGVVLTLTMVFITALAMTRERERGTMENLLATPVRPLEVIVGKITPYILIGYAQAGLIIVTAYYLFNVPLAGSLTLLLFACLPFIAANLAMGLTFSTIAKNQLQAIQGAMFFFLPSLLLSGFLFPFRGMPQWAQYIGNLLPLTHFEVIVRGIFLKGNDFATVWGQIWPIIVFTLVVVIIGLRRFRQTLD